MNINDYREKGKHLPKFLKDFHDQKDFFKALQNMYAKEFEENLPNYHWVNNHIYTVDYFLWFCAKHGYGLKKLQSKEVEFTPLSVTIETFKQKQFNSLELILSNEPSAQECDASKD